MKFPAGKDQLLKENLHLSFIDPYLSQVPTWTLKLLVHLFLVRRLCLSGKNSSSRFIFLRQRGKWARILLGGTNPNILRSLWPDFWKNISDHYFLRQRENTFMGSEKQNQKVRHKNPRALREFEVRSTYSLWEEFLCAEMQKNALLKKTTYGIYGLLDSGIFIKHHETARKISRKFIWAAGGKW